MVYVFGSRLYGKVDNVKGLFHVATKFGHFDYFPLFPMGSWLVTEKDGNGWRGIPIPVSLKSVLMGWMRAVALFALAGGIAGMVIAIGDLQNSRPTPARVLTSGRVIPARSTSSAAMTGIAFSTSLVVASLFLLIGSRYVPGLGKASPRRAEELGRLLGLSEDVLQALRNNMHPSTGGFEVLPARGLQQVSAGGH